MGIFELQDLVDTVFSLQPITFIIDKSKEIGLLDESKVQAEFIESIFGSVIYKKCPLPLNYCRDLLYRLIKEIESKNKQVSDCVYSCLYQIQVESLKQVRQHSHIILSLKNNGNNNIPGKEYPLNFETKRFAFKFEYCNSIGMRPWSAGFYLTEWLIHCSNLDRGIVNSNVIELGSGIGISSIITFLTIPTSSIYSTDCENEIIDNIKYNYFINGINLDDIGSKHDFKVKVGCLDWESIDIFAAEELIKYLERPLIISSDVIYDNGLTFHFAKTLMYILKAAYKKQFGKYPENYSSFPDKVSWKKLPTAKFEYISIYAISVNTIRNEETIQYFVDCCIQNGMNVSIDKTKIPTLFRYELIAPIVVFIIHY